MGHATSGVILSTVRLAADLDYNLIVVEDGCADRDPEVHQLLMEKVFPRQGTVVIPIPHISSVNYRWFDRLTTNGKRWLHSPFALG